MRIWVVDEGKSLVRNLYKTETVLVMKLIRLMNIEYCYRCYEVWESHSCVAEDEVFEVTGKYSRTRL